MGEEIKCGTMVWVWFEGLGRWSDTVFELRATGSEAYAYSDGESLYATCEVTATNPHTGDFLRRER